MLSNIPNLILGYVVRKLLDSISTSLGILPSILAGIFGGELTGRYIDLQTAEWDSFFVKFVDTLQITVFGGVALALTFSLFLRWRIITGRFAVPYVDYAVVRKRYLLLFTVGVTLMVVAYQATLHGYLRIDDFSRNFAGEIPPEFNVVFMFGMSVLAVAVFVTAFWSWNRLILPITVRGPLFWSSLAFLARGGR